MGGGGCILLLSLIEHKQNKGLESTGDESYHPHLSISLLLSLIEHKQNKGLKSTGDKKLSSAPVNFKNHAVRAKACGRHN